MEALSTDVSDFWVGSSVKVLNNPTSIEFLRECVASYQPAILTGLIGHWPAIKDWDLATICEKLDCSSALTGESRLLKVNMTPDGLGDCVKLADHPVDIVEPAFFYPAECLMSTKLFVEMMTNPMENDAVPYLSLQNDNLRVDMPELMADIQASLLIAEEAFGQSQPEAGK